MRSKIRVPILITLATTPVVVFTVGYAMAHGVMGSVEVHGRYEMRKGTVLNGRCDELRQGKSILSKAKSTLSSGMGQEKFWAGVMKRILFPELPLFFFLSTFHFLLLSPNGVWTYEVSRREIWTKCRRHEPDTLC